LVHSCSLLTFIFKHNSQEERKEERNSFEMKSEEATPPVNERINRRAQLASIDELSVTPGTVNAVDGELFLQLLHFTSFLMYQKSPGLYD
jgi:hypothetical protein